MMALGKSLKYPFADRQSLVSTLKGGLFTLLFFTVFFAFATVGYLTLILCNCIDGRRSTMPKWQKLGELFNEGIMPIIIILTYISPVVVLLIIKQIVELTMGNALQFIYPMAGTFLLLSSLVLPLALIHYAVKGQFRAAFDLRRVFAFIAENTVRYIFIWLLSMTIFASIWVGAFALLTFDVPLALFAAYVLLLPFVHFAAAAMTVNLFGSIYRDCEPFEDDADGKERASMVVPPPLR